MSSQQSEQLDASEYFDRHSFYRFHNKNRPNETLIIESGNGDTDMAQQFTTSSSENWQIYYQQGRWFIRPYATSTVAEWTDYQLALTTDGEGGKGRQPKVVKRSGALGQQWSFTPVDDGNGGYGYRISNALLGDKQFLALTGDEGEPGMQSSSEGTVWDMQINTSAGSPTMDNSYEDVVSVAVPPVSSTSTTMSLTLSTSAAKASPTSTPITSETSTFTPKPAATAGSSSSLGSGAIAGIVVGAVVVVLVVTGASFFFAKRRKRRYAGEKEVNYQASQDVKVVYSRMHEPVEMENTEPARRYELGNAHPCAAEAAT